MFKSFGHAAQNRSTTLPWSLISTLGMLCFNLGRVCLISTCVPFSARVFAAVSFECTNPLFQSHWYSTGSDIAHLSDTPVAYMDLVRCRMWNGHRSCCNPSMEAPQQLALNHRQKLFNTWKARLERYLSALTQLQQSEVFQHAEATEQALLNKAIDAFQAPLGHISQCIQSLMVFSAGMICFGCNPQWNKFVWRDTAGSVTAVNVAGESCVFVGRQCGKFGLAMQQLMASIMNSVLAKVPETPLPDLAMLGDRESICDWLRSSLAMQPMQDTVPDLSETHTHRILGSTSRVANTVIGNSTVYVPQYVAINHSSTVQDAQRACGNNTLAIARNLQEQEALDAVCRHFFNASDNATQIWLGGRWRTDKGRWEWDDGTTVSNVMDWESAAPTHGNSSPYMCQMIATGKWVQCAGEGERNAVVCSTGYKSYKFTYFVAHGKFNAQEALRACSASSKPMPKTLAEQSSLQEVLRRTKTSISNITQDISLFFLGGMWSSKISRWEWNDGTPVSKHLVWDQAHASQMSQNSSICIQASTGKMQVCNDADSPFGVICMQNVTTSLQPSVNQAPVTHSARTTTFVTSPTVAETTSTPTYRREPHGSSLSQVPTAPPYSTQPAAALDPVRDGSLSGFNLDSTS